MKLATTLLSSVLALALAACDEGVAPSQGLASKLRVTGGEYISADYPVPFEPAPTGGADAGSDDDAGLPPPRVNLINSPNNTVRVGSSSKTVTAFVSQNARTVAIALEGEPGYFRVPVGVTSVENAPDLEVKVAFTFDPSIAPGDRKIWFAAADENGQFGYGRYLAITLEDPAQTAPLAVALSWQPGMDLDLLVKLPDGSTLEPRRFRNAEGDRVAQSDDTPYIPVDSMMGCIPDGLLRETALFPAPLSGSYEVSVRLAAACGLPSASWQLQVLREGEEVGNASGATYAWEADQKNGGPEGPGRFALRFNVAD